MVTGSSGRVGEKLWLWPGFAAPGVLWLLLLFLLPFYAIFALAMGRLDPIFVEAVPVWNPVEWNPETLIKVVTEIGGGQLSKVFYRTVAYVLVATALCLLIGYPVAYYVARHAGTRKVLLLLLIIAPFWINYLMRMLAWVNLLEPNGYVNRALILLGVLDAPRQWLTGKHETVILGLVYGYIPFLILPLFAALDRIDTRIIEAARDLGATSWQAFRRVTLPLSRQGMLAGAVIVMLPMFGDYYTPNLLSGSPKTRMVGNLIDQSILSGGGTARGASLTIVLMALVGVLMTYYLVSVARASREET